MWRGLLFLNLILYLQNVEGQIFIGRGSSNLYFALRTDYEWDWALNYCHNFRLMPASIETEADHRLITNFLNTSTSIEDEFRFLWLPATDHRREGVFQWMWNMEEVSVGSWAPGMPSINRTANCLAINRFGNFMEESCQNSGRRYYALCAAQIFYHEKREVFDIQMKHKNANNAATHNEDEIDDQALQSLTVIGIVGDTMYFTGYEQISWTESLDLCHSAGLRLATPEQPEQLDFIQKYAAEQNTIFYLGGSDRLSVSCLQSNTEFRWFYSGNPIANQTNLAGNDGWYLCTLISPERLYATGCAKGGGAFARPICEIGIAESDLFSSNYFQKLNLRN